MRMGRLSSLEEQRHLTALHGGCPQVPDILGVTPSSESWTSKSWEVHQIILRLEAEVAQGLWAEEGNSEVSEAPSAGES